MTSNTELTIVDQIKNNELVITDGSEYKVPLSVVFGKGVIPKQDSFGDLTLAENSIRVDKAIDNMSSMIKVWNHTHSQWDWKHVTLSHNDPWKNMKQIEAEMQRKRAALNEAKWRNIKNEIKLRKYEEELSQEGIDHWKEIDLKVKIMEMKEGMAEGMHFIEGAMKDVLVLNELYEQLKEIVSNFTEEDYERSESKANVKRAVSQSLRDIRQFGVITKGEQEYLEQIGINPSKAMVLMRRYLEEEINDPDWNTDKLIKFLDDFADDMIDNHKVDIKRVAAMQLDPEIKPGIGYNKPVASKEE